MTREFLPRSKGFSLIEILIALGLMGLSAMVIAGLFSQQMHMQRFIVKKMDLADLRRVATDVMAHPLSCMCNLQNVNVNPNAEFRDLAQIRAQFIDMGAGPDCNTGEVLTRVNSPLVESIRMENFRDLGFDRHSYELVLYPQNTQGHVSLQPIRLQNLMVEVVGGAVQSCGSVDSLLGQGAGPIERRFYSCRGWDSNNFQDCPGLVYSQRESEGSMWPNLTTEEEYDFCTLAYTHRELNQWLRATNSRSDPSGEKDTWTLSLGAGINGEHRLQFTCFNFD